MVHPFLKMEVSPLLEQGLLQFIFLSSGSYRVCKKGPSLKHLQTFLKELLSLWRSLGIYFGMGRLKASIN